MTQIRKILDKQGDEVFIRTSTKAVVDENGYTAESRLQAMQDEINQAQLEIGAVPSDLTPTEDSTNWVTSGGIYNQLNVGDANVEIELSDYTLSQAWVTTSGKWNTNGYGYFIPITPHMVFRITSPLSHGCLYAFLVSNTTGSQGSNVTTYASGCSTVKVEADSFDEAKAPSDASFLWVSHTASGEESGSNTPQSVEIVNKEKVSNIAVGVRATVGNPTMSFPKTFTPIVDNFGKSEAVKLWQITTSGTYTVEFHIDDGYTTTATGTETIFSLRTYATELPSDSTTTWMINYTFTASSTKSKFYPSMSLELELTAGQIFYYVSRLSGNGYINITPKSDVCERVSYLEAHTSFDVADPDTSNDDVATNKLDGEMAMLAKTISANTLTNLVMCFFSDIHGDTRNIQRVLDFCDHYNISCIIHGGDSVADYYGNGTPFTSETGALVMNVIGNHDSTNSSSSAYSNNVSDANLYNTFIAPFANSVVLPTDAATNGLCYWYKDYTSQGIRIIGINCMRWDSTQSTWLTNTLEDARTNDLSVVIVSHYPADDIDGFDTGFNSRQWGPAYKGRTLYQFGTGVLGLVDSFITAGGEFICYLTGHQHRDHVGTCVHATNTQIQLTIDSSSTDRHANAIYGTTMGKYSIDFDIIGIDLYQKCIKVARVGRNKDGWMREFKTMCIDYINGNLYNRYKIE